MDKNTKNPWLGLVPYSEETDLTVNPFKGREQQAKELFRLVSANVITTLYGKSGVGKSSLLAAGLFPMLKSQHCIPFKIRLYTECKAGESFAQHITDVLKEYSTPIDGLEYEPLAPDSVDYLWHFMALHNFRDKGSDALDATPILVFDQFEELLRNRNSEALLLIKQIRKLLDDGYLPNGEAYQIRFRIILSLREDDLYLLEDLLDRNSIDRMKLNRYRLGSVDKDGAREIIEMPGIEFADKEECIKRAVYYADPHNEGQISSLLLSLICFRAFNKANGKPITPDNIGPDPEKAKNKLETNTTSPIEEFYDEITSKLTNDEQKFLLDNSITDDGRRQSIKASRLNEKLSQETFNRLTDEKSQQHIFTPTSGKKEYEQYFELLHDQIAEAVYNKRQRWQSEQRTKRIKSILTTIIVTATVITLTCIFIPMRMRATTPLYKTHFQAGDTLFAPSKPYYVKSGRLIIDYGDSVVVKLGALFGIQNLRYFEASPSLLCSSSIINHIPNLSFPQTDTLVLKLPRYIVGFFDFPTIIRRFPNLKHLTLIDASLISHPLDSVAYSPSLRSIELKNCDESRWRYHNGALFYAIEGIWYPLVKNTPEITYNIADFEPDSVANAIINIDYDISNRTKLPSRSDYRIRLINTEPTKKTLSKEDLQSINKDQIISIDLPYIETIAKDNIFNYCQNLQRINMPHLQSIPESAFANDKSIHYANLPSVKNIGDGAFYCCDKLDSINVSQAKTIGRAAFNCCESLPSIKLPNATKIGEGAFKGCKSLYYVEMPNVKSLDKTAFSGCEHLRTVYLPNVKQLATNSFSETSCSELYLPKLDTIDCILDSYENNICMFHIPLDATIINSSNSNDLLKHITRHNNKVLEKLLKEYEKKIKIKYKKGYFIYGDIIYITDTIVPHLHVPKDIRLITGYNSKTSIKHITVSPRNKFFNHNIYNISYNYKSDTVLYSQPLIYSTYSKHRVYRDSKKMPITAILTTDNFCLPQHCTRIFFDDKDFRHLTYSIEKCLQYYGNRQYELLIPYGSSRIFEVLKDKEQFRIKEMGWIETLVREALSWADLKGIPYLLAAIIASTIALIIALRTWRRKKRINKIYPILLISIFYGIVAFITINFLLKNKNPLLPLCLSTASIILLLVIIDYILKRRTKKSINNKYLNKK